ncbi:TonB-dependent receptor plug domain-containing protein [Chryseobacterium wanjuense]
MGRDVLEIDKYKNNYGNLLGTLRWNSVLSSKLFSNTSIIYSNYDYKTKFSDGALSAEENPNIKNWIFKQDFTHYADPKHTFRYGIQASHYDFYTKSKTKEDLPTFLAKDRSMWENSVYFNDDYKVTDKFFINYGLRLSMLSSGKNNTYLESSGNDFKDNYLNLEPRLMLKYDFNDKNSIRTGYTRNTQNIQTLGTNGTDLTNDIWINLRKPEIADQVNFGYTRKLGDSYELNTEVFYKKMSNLVDYKDDIEGSLVDDLESNLLFNGKGRAYGLEIMAKKTRGRFTGWVSYTLSKSQRKIDGINDGEWYNARYDRTHNLSIVANYDLSPRWSLSGAFVYNTGNAVTLPVGKYEIDSQTYLQYGKRNDGRMPAYHRMDLNLTYESSSQKRFKSSWSFGVYNVYGRKNAYRLSFEPDKNNPEKINTMKTSLFSFVPNVTYNFKF